MAPSGETVKITVREYGPCIILALQGVFILDTVFSVEKKWSEILEGSPRAIAVDLKGITFLDSAAIGTLVKYVKVSKERDIELFFININDAVKKVFSATRLDLFFAVISENEFFKKFSINNSTGFHE